MSSGSNPAASDNAHSAPEPGGLAGVIPDHELVRKIGEGSYGEVWLARTLTGSYHAVKIVRRNTEDEGRAFEREFKGIENYEPISRRHPSLMEIFHVGRKEALFFYGMELADNASAGDGATRPQKGGDSEGASITDAQGYVPDTLKFRIRRDGRLPLEQCLELGLALTDALGQLHERGLAHRDVKPSNIIYVGGKPKLSDIGLVALVDATRSVVGTPGYIPPEGAGSATADLYSLGRVLYEASTGKSPEDFPEPPTTLDTDETDGWAELNEVILKACKPLPGHRYQNAQAMHRELESLKAGVSLRHARSVERRLAAFKKYSLVGAAVMVLIGAGLLFQVGQARRFKELARQSRLRLRQLYVANGLSAMEGGQFFTSLIWLTQALKETAGSQDQKTKATAAAGQKRLRAGATDEQMERERWETIWRLGPRIVRVGAHGGPIISAMFSPDGRRVLTASLDGSACVWELSDGGTLLRLRHAQALAYAAFNHDGSRIVTCCEDGAARVWDAATGKLCFGPLRHDGKVLYAAFSPDGTRLVTCGADSSAKLWDARSGKLVRILFKTNGEVNYAEFSPDGCRFVTASDDNTARVWDAFSGQPAGPPLEHPDDVRQARFSPDGRRIVTACRDGNARIFDAQTGRLLIKPLKHSAPLLYAFFSPDGTRVIAGGGGARPEDGEVRVWDAGTGEPISHLAALRGRTRTSALSPDGRYIATGSEDKNLFVWELSTGRLLTPPLRHNGAVSDVRWSANGHEVLTASRDGAWRLWELAVGAALDPVWRQSATVVEATFTKDDRRILVRGVYKHDRGDSGLWDPLSGSYLPVGEASRGPLLYSLISPKKTFIASCYSPEQPVLHDGRNGRLLRVLEGCTNATRPLCFSPDEKLLLVACQDRVARFWLTATGKQTGPSLRHDQEIVAGIFSPDGQIVVTGTGPHQEAPGNGQVYIWSVKGGGLLCAPIKVDGSPGLAISPNGRWLLVGSRDTGVKPHFAQLREIRNGQPVGPQLWHGDGVSCVAFTPDGTKVVTASEDGACRLWDVPTGRPATSWLLHKAGIAYLSFAPDGRRMVTASSDRTAIIWDTVTGEALSPPLPHGDEVESARFNEAGTAIVTGCMDGTCHVWRLPTTDRPIADLEMTAQFQSGLRLDDTGGLSPLSSGELVALWQELVRKYPADFMASQQDEVTWHRLQEEECEAAHQWRAAQFHVERMLHYRPTDAALQSRLLSVEAHLPRQCGAMTRSGAETEHGAK
jgi:WD40 repeat protein